MEQSDLRIERMRRRRRENRQAIVHAAERAMLKKGFGAVTMDDVAGEAQFSKATVYRYFRHKGELLLEIMSQYFDDIRKRLAEIAAGDGTASERLRESIRFVLQYHKDKSAVSRMIFLDPAMFRMMRVFLIQPPSSETSPYRAFLDMIHEKKAATHAEGARILREGMASGEFRKLDISSALRFIDAVVKGYIHELFWIEDRDDSTMSADILHDHILMGIGGGNPGRKKGGRR